MPGSRHPPRIFLASLHPAPGALKNLGTELASPHLTDAAHTN
jgi:hypothetical protein